WGNSSSRAFTSRSRRSTCANCGAEAKRLPDSTANTLMNVGPLAAVANSCVAGQHFARRGSRTGSQTVAYHNRIGSEPFCDNASLVHESRLSKMQRSTTGQADQASKTLCSFFSTFAARTSVLLVLLAT